DYRDIQNYFYENSRGCGINVTCSEADGYEEPIDATAYLVMGGYICSGVMLNNVRQDLTPYFLTASFCVEGGSPSTFKFYFNFEADECDESSSSEYGNYAYGSELLQLENEYSNGMSALLEITGGIEEDVFYAGWDATGNTPNISCLVHHPAGDFKRLNLDNDPAYGCSFMGGAQYHWCVDWDEGGYEGGSAGAGLFDSQFKVVGQLSGGPGDCSNGFNSYHGKFSASFNAMKEWLDPDNTGALVINGTYEVLDSELNVPGDYATIQDAIDNADDGATVLVTPGTYSGVGNIDLNFEGKAITVISESGPDSTIIDCGGEERGITFEYGEDSTAVFDGFTITNGERT
ncbi:uncharacterized protein METZ01_LOCUS324153, partial [marine metagenome]